MHVWGYAHAQKTYEKAMLSPQADLEALHKQLMNAKAEVSTAYVLKACPNTQTSPQIKRKTTHHVNSNQKESWSDYTKTKYN